MKSAVPPDELAEEIKYSLTFHFLTDLSLLLYFMIRRLAVDGPFGTASSVSSIHAGVFSNSLRQNVVLYPTAIIFMAPVSRFNLKSPDFL